MNRLTTDKPVSKMSMVELAHNSCYTKDGVARYRDYETEIDAIELARDLMLSYRLLEENDTAAHDEDALNDELVESLAYGPKEIEGLIALFYRSILAMSDLREWLKEYEDAEEQGLLVKLPCAVGDIVYVITTCKDFGKVLDGTLWGEDGGFGTATGYYCPYESSDTCPFSDFDEGGCEIYENKLAVFEDYVEDIMIYENETIVFLGKCGSANFDSFGKTIFLTREEALKAMNEKENGNE